MHIISIMNVKINGCIAGDSHGENFAVVADKMTAVN